MTTCESIATNDAGAVLENLGHDKRICVIYANFKAQRDGVLDSGFLRFFGSVELHETGAEITL